MVLHMGSFIHHPTMPKRRRERDRPKASHEAPYNPNKRILLSYESDAEEDGEVAQSNGVEQTLPQDADLGYSKIKEDVKEEHVGNDAEVDLQEDEEVAEEPPAQEPRPEESPRKNDSSLWTRGGTLKNSFTGQWAALGSLSYQFEDGQEEEEFSGEEAEAMAYLRGVRTERQAMPEFFSAPNDDMYNSGLGDTRGYFEDGAYVAAPILGPMQVPTATVEPQDAFATALKTRFLEQRKQLHVNSSHKVLESLGEKHPTAFPNGNKAYAHWHRTLQFTQPQPAQIRAMDQDTVVRVLDLLQDRFLQREKEISANMSAWVWSLLARLDDVGSMDSDRVNQIRQFGKRAILIQVSFRDPDAARELERAGRSDGNGIATTPTASNADIDEEEENETTSKRAVADADNAVAAAAVDISADSQAQVEELSHKNTNGDAGAENMTASTATKSSQQTATNATRERATEEGSKRMNTLATLDTIIVLVGDVFGQRDLLEFRQPWTMQED